MLCPIFLDFDGVLNSHQHFIMRKKKNARPEPADTLNRADFNRAVWDLNPHNVWNLEFILQSVPNSRIVLSTSWRHHFSTTILQQALIYHGADGSRVIGKTNKLNRRHEEIELWLDTVQPRDFGFESVGKFAVIDDYVVFPTEREEMFKTDQMTGLSYRDACMVIEYLNPEWRRPLVLL